MTDSVEAVLFDIDGTLCEYRRDGSELLELTFETLDVDPFFDLGDYYERFGDAIEAGNDTIDEIREYCFADIARDSGRDPEVGRELADVYALERDHSDVVWMPGAKESLDAIDERYPIAAVTNGGPEMQNQKLSGLGIEDRFETVVYAGHELPAKPKPDAFYQALAYVDAEPETVVHVGNSVRSDVRGAKNAGVRSAWIRDGDGSDGFVPTPRPDYVLNSMHDLTDKIEV
jgi:FMN phosphatase YigB (HAD superfamily)